MESADVLEHLSYSVKDFDYPLPVDKIATYPKQKRDESKLLVYKDQNITDVYYHQIDQFLPSDSLLVFNNTRVIQARLHFKTTSGATIEIFCLEPSDNHIEVNLAMQAT